MDSPGRIPCCKSQDPQLLLSPSSRRRTTSDPNSPEFEFWMLRNPSFPQPNLLSADELFVDGVLLPLHLLPLHQHNTDPGPPDDPDEPTNSLTQPEPEPGPQISHTTATTTLSASKRWKDIFKKGDKKTTTTKNQEDKDRDKEKKRDRRSQNGGSSSSAELNINIWPFSRSRSAGNSGTRPKMFPGAPATRKVSSAPCSRSNSAGESKSRKWPNSPGRAGVHLGRSSPVWQVRRGSGGSLVKSSYSEPSAPLLLGRNGASKNEVTTEPRGCRSNTSGESKARVLNLNVPMCIGYRQHLSCRSDENSAVGVGGGGGGGKSSSTGTATRKSINVGNGGGGNLFNFRSLFTKKVY